MSAPHPLAEQCTATSKATGQRCRRRVVGGSVCIVHGGKAPQVAAKREGRIVEWEARTEISAWSALTGRPTVDPGIAVLAALQMSWLRLHVYSGLLEQQFRNDSTVTFLRRPGSDPDLTDGDAANQSTPGGVQGLIGHTYAADRSAGVFASGEAVRALVTLEAQERDRVVRYAKTAHDMGIADREVRLAERQGQLLHGVLVAVLREMGHDVFPGSQAAQVILRHLAPVIAGEVEPGDAS